MAGGRNADALRWAREVLGARAKRAEIIPGNVEAVLKADAARCDADLIVMGAYGHSPLGAFIVGSTTTTVMRSFQLPVLLFR